MEATEVSHYRARDINGDSCDDRSPPSTLRRHMSGFVAAIAVSAPDVAPCVHGRKNMWHYTEHISNI